MRAIVFAAALASAFGAAPAAFGQDAFTFLSVGSGELDGGYYRTSRAICDIVQRTESRSLRCSTEATQGSRYNVQALAAEELDFALVQGDVAYGAVNGAGTSAGDAPATTLRTVAPLYFETVTLLTAAEAHVEVAADLQGLRVDIGPPASGRNATTRKLLGLLDLDSSFFGEIRQAPTANAIDLLCAGRLDAIVLVVRHPSEAVADAMERCGARLAPLAGPNISRIIADAPYYRPGVTPAAAYDALDEDVPTLDVAALLLTSASVSAQIVRRVAGALFTESAALADRAPLLAGFVHGGLDLVGAPPLHRGATGALEALEAPTD
jgi:TRAP transporter TAXI family solute receptor